MLKNEKCKKIVKYCIIVLSVALISLLTEVLFNINAIKDSYNEEIANDTLILTGCEITQEGIVIGDEGGNLTIDIDGRYVNKLSYGFTRPYTELMVNATISVEKSNVYGDYENITITDNNPYLISKSDVNIGEKVNKITITFASGQEGLLINNISISNTVQFNKERLLFFFSLYILITVVVFTRKIWSSKSENIFLVIAITVGTVFVWLLPASKVGWDEEAHFKRAYTLPISLSSVVTPTVNEYSVVSLTNWPYNITQSKEEKMELAMVLDTRADYRDEAYIEYFTVSNKDNLTRIYNFHYIPSSIGIKIGQLFNMSFSYVYILGRWFNLIAYSIIVFFAIKKLAFGKNIMSALALMPTPMFLASTYSYDAMVIALLFLGISYLISEMANKTEIISKKNMVISLVAVSVGALAKAVYIPIILIGLMMPKSKFKSKKQHIIFKSAIVVLFILLMSTFVLPSLLSPPEVGDVRGGDTSTSEQMKLIFSKPFAYFDVWLNNVGETFFDYTIGKSSLASMGHIAISPCANLIIIFMTAVIFTDSRREDSGTLVIREKVGIGATLIITIALIWTALYLSFTEVGKTQIAGVQGRYYIPLLFPLFILLRPKNIENKISKEKYYLIVYGIIIYILFKTIYECVLIPYNL